MIIARSPLRITLGGGGTDLPSYYRNHAGFLIAAAIDKYVYVTVMRPFTEGVYLKYSDLEHVVTVDEIRHPIIREALRMQHLRTPQIEITTLADIPARIATGKFTKEPPSFPRNRSQSAPPPTLPWSSHDAVCYGHPRRT